MAQYNSPHLLLALVLLVVGWSDFVFGTPLEKADQHGSHRHHKWHAAILSRSARSFPEESPCVTIPHLSELKKRFVQSLDHNNDGLATFDEVKDYMRRFKSNVKDEDVKAFIHRRDMNGNGVIDFVPDYVQDMSVPDYSLGSATEWFRLQDTDDDGFVSEAELLNTTEALGVPPEEAESTIQGYYMGADVNGDKRLSFDEFKTLYNQ